MRNSLTLQGVSLEMTPETYISRLVGQQYAYKNVVDFLTLHKDHMNNEENTRHLISTLLEVCQDQVTTIDKALDNMQVKDGNHIESARWYRGNQTR